MATATLQAKVHPGSTTRPERVAQSTRVCCLGQSAPLGATYLSYPGSLDRAAGHRKR